MTKRAILIVTMTNKGTLMKIYLNPQPHAVERINQLKNKPSSMPVPKHKKVAEEHSEKSDTEIFETESEEQAWRDSLEKDKHSAFGQIHLPVN